MNKTDSEKLIKYYYNNIFFHVQIWVDGKKN